MMKKIYLRVIWSFLIVFGITLAPFGAAQAEEDGMGKTDTVEEIDVDDLLDTLNETLKENRKLRKRVEKTQGDFEKITVENNAVRSQLRALQRRMQKQNMELEQRVKEINEKKDEIRDLRKRNDEKAATIKQANEDLMKSGDQVKQLQSTLDTAILESERDQYKSLIRSLSTQTDTAVQELAKASYQHQQMRSELAYNYFRLGNGSFQQKNYDSAIGYYKRALDLNPRIAGAHYNLGVIYDFYLHDNPSAIDHYRRYLDLDPEDASAPRVRERLLDMNLLKKIVPDQPLKTDFGRYHKKRQ